MSFARPALLLLLLLPILMAAWEMQRRGHPLVLPFDHSAVRGSPWWQRLITALNLVPCLLLSVAILLLAGPRRLTTTSEERVVSRIVICLDVSGSMTAQFGDGRRADKAIEAVQEFTSYRAGDAFGLSVFGTDVIHWVPITKDLSAIRLSAPFLRPEKMPPYMGGTRIGHALRSIRANLTSQSDGDRMVILISDGMSADLFAGQAEEIGNALRDDRITLYYIHVASGAPQNETFTLASLTGGQAFAAGDPQALREVFRRIDEMQPARSKPGTPEFADFFWPFTLAGMGLLGLQTLSLFGLRFTPW